MNAFVAFLLTEGGLSRCICRAVSATSATIDTREELELEECVALTFSGSDGTEITWGSEVHSIAERAPGRYRAVLTLLRVEEETPGGYVLVRPDSDRLVH